MDDENDAHVCLKMGIRIGNFGLQRNSLSAAVPLYVSAAKSNYMTAIAHYLSIIAAHPKLEERLNYSLETFGVRFIKQNVYENIIDEKNLRDQIKSSQDERERIDLLMSEYFNDYAVSYSEQAIKSQYIPTEMHKKGFSRLFDCYPNSLEQIKAVYWQEVLKTEDRNPQGRRTIGVVRTKMKDYNSKKKAEKRKIVILELTQPVVEDLNETSLTIEPQSKRRKIADAIGSVREKLSEV
ncbi:hypothetical protein C1646_771549 [Rhizophagus diaphanus]|nr:hypothetical protein C1646_771549 [Rhizophagus diaphanus] [Rhizophagus sp. MUCL 43196]